MPQNEEKKLMQKKHRGGRVVLCVLLVLLIVAGVACYWLRDVISIAYHALNTPAEAVQSQKEENDKKQQELLNQLAAVTMRDLTDEEFQKYLNGELSHEEVLALIRGETYAPVTTAVPVETTAVATEPVERTDPVVPAVTAGAVAAATEPPLTTAQTTTTAVTAVTSTTATTAERIDFSALQRRQEEIIAEIYLLRSTYLNEIEKLIEDTKQAYRALPKEEHTLAGKMKLVEKMIPKGNKLEDDCDARMEELLGELTDILQRQGLSTAIVDEIRTTYKEQKELKLAELYQQYGSKLEE